jgi:hypothetical protein
VDLTDGNADSLSLDTLMGSIGTMRAAGNDVRSLILMGDAQDSLDLNGKDMGTAAHTGVSIDGVNGIFDHYIIDTGQGGMLDIYIQQQVLATTG